MKRSFHIGDLVTVTIGRRIAPRHMDAVYDLIDFVTGVPHFTHQLGRAAEEITPYLHAQHPWLAEIQDPGWVDDADTADLWLRELVEQHGKYHDVEAMPADGYTPRDPIAELQEMVPDKPITTVVVDNREGME